MSKNNDYVKHAEEIANLVTEKQLAYGDSHGQAGDVLKILYPSGISPDQYTDALTVVRIVDKLFRLANQKDAFGESPYKDIMGYALLGLARDDRKRPQKTERPLKHKTPGAIINTLMTTSTFKLTDKEHAFVGQCYDFHSKHHKLTADMESKLIQLHCQIVQRQELAAKTS